MSIHRYGRRTTSNASKFALHKWHDILEQRNRKCHAFFYVQDGKKLFSRSNQVVWVSVFHISICFRWKQSALKNQSTTKGKENTFSSVRTLSRGQKKIETSYPKLNRAVTNPEVERSYALRIAAVRRTLILSSDHHNSAWEGWILQTSQQHEAISTTTKERFSSIYKIQP